MAKKDGESDDSERGSGGEALSAHSFSQLVMGVFLLTALLLSTGLPERLGIEPLTIVLPTITPSPSATAVPPTATPRPLRVYLGTPTPTPGPATPTPIVRRYRVGNTGGDGVSLRSTPRLADRLAVWRDGAIMEVVGKDQVGDGITFKQVRDPRGNVGFIPSQYLVPIPAE